MLSRHPKSEFVRLAALAGKIAKSLRDAAKCAEQQKDGLLECELGSFQHHLPDLSIKAGKLALKAESALHAATRDTAGKEVVKAEPERPRRK